jgi:hypothetical protein
MTLAMFLDAMTEPRSGEAALAKADALKSVIAPGTIFSVQLNATTREDPPDWIRLRRIYSSEPGRFPVDAIKLKGPTAWTRRVFQDGRIFVGEGVAELAEHFDDYEQMRPLGLQSFLNVPLLAGNLCYATFNVFGTRERWHEEELLALRVLALATARWISAAPDLWYSFTDESATVASAEH